METEDYYPRYEWAQKIIKLFLEHSRECANDWEHDIHYEDIVEEAKMFLTGLEPGKTDE